MTYPCRICKWLKLYLSFHALLDQAIQSTIIVIIDCWNGTGKPLLLVYRLFFICRFLSICFYLFRLLLYESSSFFVSFTRVLPRYLYRFAGLLVIHKFETSRTIFLQPGFTRTHHQLCVWFFRCGSFMHCIVYAGFHVIIGLLIQQSEAITNVSDRNGKLSKLAALSNCK